MNTSAEVRLWGKTIGAVLLKDGEQFASFEYEKAFQQSGIQVSPITMPLGNTVYRFPALSLHTFHGLPGLLADSLPDRFGNAVIDAWLAKQGRTPQSFNPVERLCYTGERGMGALEFFPVVDQGKPSSSILEIEQLVQLASEILSERKSLSVALPDNDPFSEKAAMRQILQVGTSAGGARAKAVIAWNPTTGVIHSGQVKNSPKFQYWLLKFDGVQANGDRELSDPVGYGAIEYAYYHMACAAGIEMSECRLLEENGRRHFMTRRFDRTETGGKIHMQSLGALAHYDFNLSRVYSYEQVFQIIRQLGMSIQTVEQFFRRMVFNIVARNQDDHVKNIAFLMDQHGVWRLAPAYDVTYSFKEDGIWTGQHQMAMNGKFDGFLKSDFTESARTAGLVRGRSDTIVNEVCASVEKWMEFAGQAGVPELRAKQIERTFRFF